MKPGKALLLIIGSFIWLLHDLSGIIFRHVEYGKYETWTSLILSVFFLIVPVVWILFGYSYLKRDETLRKKVAIAGTAVYVLWLGTMLYFSITGFETSFFRSEPLKYILIQTHYIQITLFIVFWLLLVAGKKEKTGGWLLAAGLLVAFSVFFERIFGILGYGYFMDGGMLSSTHEILGIANILFPVSLVAFAVWLLKGETPAVPVFKQEAPQFSSDEGILDLEPLAEQVSAEVVAVPSVPRVIDWISDFLMLLIPVFGFVFLLWRGMNKRDRYRRNWALASLFWSTLGLGGYLFLYYPILEYVDRDGLILVVTGCVIIALLIFWALALNKVRNDDFDDNISEEDVPSTLTWIGWTCLAGLPIVGLIMLIVWAVDTSNELRRNWAIAQLIFIGVVLMYYLSLYKWFVLNVGDLSRISYRF